MGGGGGQNMGGDFDFNARRFVYILNFLKRKKKKAMGKTTTIHPFDNYVTTTLFST